MACGGCAERGRLIGVAGSAAFRGAWTEAASAASAAAVSVKVDVAAAAARVARATASALARKGR